MRTYSLSITLTLTTVVTTGLPLAVQAATFNYDQLQLITTRPIESDSFLSFTGTQTAFFNANPNAPDSGHLEISLNSPGNPAPYYATGLQSSPLATGETRSGTLDGVTNFTNFFNYLTNNNIDFNDIGFGYGQKSDRAFTETWNLGDDILGQDWLGSTDSSIEERIYQADPNAVESFITWGDTKIISFGYTPFYAVFEYGESEAVEDDVEVIFSEALTVNKFSDLNSLADGLANAFLQDVNENGGGVQFFIEDFAVETSVPIFDPNTGFVVVDFPLPLNLRAVSVPEPSSIVGLLTIGSLGLTSILKKAKSQ
ncbi:PEP-CTERM sorting domain-containing protein [Capilliphycus salinus ALCB114379]|uniref:PEP-CTERM sorting domain-containing protein n=1 Tax=Capilliphycus salinus TaxID=2768948 RepID=UPI0039A40793